MVAEDRIAAATTKIDQSYSPVALMCSSISGPHESCPKRHLDQLIRSVGLAALPSRHTHKQITLDHNVCSSKKVKVAHTRLSSVWFRTPELIPVLGSQPAGDVNHKPGVRLPLLSPRPAVAPATLKRAAIPILLLGEQKHNWCEQFA